MYYKLIGNKSKNIHLFY